MALSGNNKVCAEIAAALGIKNCRKLVLHMEVDSIVHVEAEFYPEKDGVMALEPILKKFKLIEIE